MPGSVARQWNSIVRPFLATARVEATAPMDGGLWYFLGGYAIRFLRMYLLLGVWKSIYVARGAQHSDELRTLFLYTILASAFYQQVNVVTTASSTLWEGSVGSRFLRPSSVFGQYAAETVGRWIPGLLFFSAPVVATGWGVAHTLGVRLPSVDVRVLPWFALSLLLGIAAGFALDFIFTGVMLWFGDMHYFAYQIRGAVSALLSGAFIPLYLLPKGLEQVLELLPFAAMASAPLQIVTGTGDAHRLIPLQAVWCVVLWVGAAVVWQRNRQRLVIFGG